MAQIDPGRYRQVLGQYPTGVVVVTALNDHEEPVGMTVGSFTSVSLNPPLVAFLPSRTSSSWADLRAAGDRFCINILSVEQEHVCRAVATRKVRKFDDIGLRRSPGGNPIVDGAVAWIDCTTETIHAGGDHEIVVGRVLDLDVETTTYPLLFFRGGYGSFTPLSLVAGDADLVDQLRYVDLARAQMEKLAAGWNTEVSAFSLIGDEIVVSASAGRSTFTAVPTRVGERVPFVPPLGSVHAAFGPDDLCERWLAHAERWAKPDQLIELTEIPARIRERGYGISLGHEPAARMELLGTRWRDRDPDVSEDDLGRAIVGLTDAFNPDTIDETARYELRTVAAPVFTPDGRLAFVMNVWGPMEPVTGRDIDEIGRALTGAAGEVDLSSLEARQHLE